MTFSLTNKARILSSQNNIQPQLVLKIDGIPYLFGALPVTTIGRFDEGHLFDEGLFFDKPIEDPYSRDYISMESPTTNNITQQILQDKGGTSSISGFVIKLVNKNNELAEIFKTGNLVADIISRRAKVYMGFIGSVFPDDYILIFSGIIDEFDSSSGSAVVSIAHPDVIKRQEFFVNIKGNLTSSITNVQTNIPVNSTTGVIAPADIQETYIRIDDELMKVTSFTSNSFTVQRGQLETVAVTHDLDAEFSTFYRLQSTPIQLALKLMLSDGLQSFTSSEQIKSINYYSPTLYVQNALFFDDFNIEQELGLVEGDFIQITGSVLPANNITSTVLSFGTFEGGSYVVLADTLQDESTTTASFSFKSQYNVLNEGLAMLPEEVDVSGHLEQEYLFGTGFPELDIYLKDTINGKEFLDKEIYFPCGLYSIPRKARASCKMSAPPLSTQKVLNLNSETVSNLSQLKVRRSVHKNFYNAIVYKFNNYTLEDKFLNGRITYSSDSSSRINFGTKPLNIESKGLRNTAGNIQFIDRQSSRFLDRFKYATEYIDDVKVLFKDSFNYEVGDIVTFGGEDVQLVDYATGEKFYKKRLMEIVNKSVNFKTGEIKLSLLSTAFSLDGRYAVISMSSYVHTQTTLTRLKLKQSFYDGTYDIERLKYENYIGQEFRIRNEDYTYDQTFILEGFDPSNTGQIIVSGMTVLATDDCIIEIPDYDDSDQNAQVDFKIEYAFLNPQEEIASVTDASNFEVTNVSRFSIGSIIQVHNDDYTSESQEVKVINIAGNLITTDAPLNYIPIIGDFIELIGFVDGGLPYRIL